MRKTCVALMVMGLLASPAGAVPSGRPGDPVTGLWINPHHSVAVQNELCGNALCGRVVWASSGAKEDARDSGVPNLIGVDLLQDYRPRGPGEWKGTVFVPDMGHKFSSELDVLGPDRIRISGCILHGLVCKSQVWTRIAELPK